ncbi:MAG: hypothetical protein QOI08_3728 [Actinomycetota bacterium]|nr:hypothetical protein [Actinomycetota bacterium]
MKRHAPSLQLTEEQRTTLAALADALIPGGAGLPSAVEADVHGKWVDRVLAVRTDLVDRLSQALSDDGVPREALERWRVSEPDVFDAITFVVSSAYFLNPRVRRLLGYPGRAPMRNPALPDESDFYLEGGILDPVIARGAIYRPTPDA